MTSATSIMVTACIVYAWVPGGGRNGATIVAVLGDDTVVFACNIPGHFEAGMKHVLPITVASGD